MNINAQNAHAASQRQEFDLKYFRERSAALEQQLAESQSNLEKMAAENAGLLEFIKDDCWIYDLDDEEYRDAVYYAPQTPAADAFVAEVRASGADECVRQLVISDDDDFSDAPNVCAMVAHQLRQGGAE